jgi:serine/threonine protein kinase
MYSQTQNFLVSRRFNLKLSDFGESRAAAQPGHAPMTGEIGTTQWMAPEMMRGEAYTQVPYSLNANHVADGSQLPQAVDVYSLGIVLWEILTEQHPFVDIKDVHLVYFVLMKVLVNTRGSTVMV